MIETDLLLESIKKAQEILNGYSETDFKEFTFDRLVDEIYEQLYAQKYAQGEQHG